jgi:hypothetical protein
LGYFGSTVDFIRLFFNDATLFYLPGRLIAVASGVLSVWVVYCLGRRAYNTRVGLVAATFLSFSVLHVAFSHFVKTHVPASLIVAVALYLAWSIYEGKDTYPIYILAGFTAGLGAGTIYHAGFVLISIFIAHVLRWINKPETRSGRFIINSKSISAILACLIAFFICTPYAILDWRTFIGDLSSSGKLFISGGFWEKGVLYPFSSLIDSMGPTLGVTCLLGLGYALVRRRPVDIILGSQPMLLGAFLMIFRAKEPQHMLIAFPALSILGALVLVESVRWLVRGHQWQPATLALAALLIVGFPAWSSLQFSIHLGMTDTRTLAKEWVEANLPPGSKIVMDSGKYYLGDFGPSLTLSQWSLEQFISRGEAASDKNLAQRIGTRRAGYSGEAEYFRQQLKITDSHTGYDIVQILHDGGSDLADVLSYEEYLKEDVKYAIISSYGWTKYTPGSEDDLLHPEKSATYRHFYQNLQHHADLLKEFSPGSQTVGPGILIYRLSPVN